MTYHPAYAPFYVKESHHSVGRNFYVYDRRSGRQVGRAWGKRHLAQREADRRNAMYHRVHGS